MFCVKQIFFSALLLSFSLGAADYQIVVPDRCDSEETSSYLREAAFALQEGFYEALGKKFPVLRESDAQRGKKAVHIGLTSAAEKAGIKVKNLKDFESLITIRQGMIFLTGKDEMVSVRTNKYITRSQFRHYRCRLGSVRAVAEFMKSFLGSKFIMPGIVGTSTPKRKEFAPADQQIFIPSHLRFSPGRPAGLMYDYANGFYGYGDLFSYGGHSYYAAVSVEKYGKSHPEYFRMERGGKRSTAGGHLCISNPQVQELFYRELVRRFDAGAQIVQLAQTDGLVPCFCPECEKLGGPQASFGEKIWIVHLKIARRVLKTHPGKKVHILSYADTAEPPESCTDFPANVIVELTQYTPADFKKWNKLNVPGGFSVYIYNWGCYNQTGYTPKRTPEFAVRQMELFKKQNIVGIYRCGFGENFGLEGPTYYAFGQAIERKKADAGVLFDEYCRAAYQESAVPMRTFHNILNRQVAIYDRLSGGSEISNEQNASLLPRDPRALLTAMYPVPVLKVLESKLAAAERLVRSAKVKKRLQAVRAEFEYLKRLATVLHRYQNYQLAPDKEQFLILADAIKNFKSHVAQLFYKGKTKPFAGWQEFKMFGNDSMSLVLSNGRLSAGIGSPLCWNTAELLRSNYLPGAKRVSLDVFPTTAVPEFNDFDSGAWKKAPWNHLQEIQLGKLEEKSKFKVLYDKKNIYFAFISEVAVNKSFSPVGRDGSPWNCDCLEIMIDPEGMREKFFHFIWNPVPDSTWDGAYGLITDPLHPKYGTDDKEWNGQWSYQTRREGKLWYSLVTLPYSTLQTRPPVKGDIWCLNTAREGFKPNARMYHELSLWSPNFEDRKINRNRESFGEMHFK